MASMNFSHVISHEFIKVVDMENLGKFCHYEFICTVKQRSLEGVLWLRGQLVFNDNFSMVKLPPSLIANAIPLNCEQIFFKRILVRRSKKHDKKSYNN